MHGIARELGCSEKPENMVSVKRGESQAGRGALCWEQQEAREDFPWEMCMVRAVLCGDQGSAVWSAFRGVVKVAPRGERREAGTHWGSP